MNLLLRCGLRHHARHPLQSLLTLLGIAAGTALLVAMQSAQRTAERAFDQAVATVAGAATHTVTAGPNGIPVAAYAALCRELVGRPLAPSVHAIARTEVRAQRTVLRVLGVDPLADTQLRPWAAAGQRDAAPVPVGELMVTAGAFLATPALLARLSVAVGEALPITVGGRPFVARALAALDVPPAVAAGLDDVLLVDIATAQAWTGLDDRIDRLGGDSLHRSRTVCGLDDLPARPGPLQQPLDQQAVHRRIVNDQNLARSSQSRISLLRKQKDLVDGILANPGDSGGRRMGQTRRWLNMLAERGG